MDSVSAFTVRGMAATSPWQVTQPSPAATCAAWWNRTWSGRRCTDRHVTGASSASAVASGANWAETFQTCAWQPRQVSAVGMPAEAPRSTVAWQ